MKIQESGGGGGGSQNCSFRGHSWSGVKIETNRQKHRRGCRERDATSGRMGSEIAICMTIAQPPLRSVSTASFHTQFHAQIQNAPHAIRKPMIRNFNVIPSRRFYWLALREGPRPGVRHAGISELRAADVLATGHAAARVPFEKSCTATSLALPTSS